MGYIKNHAMIVSSWSEEATAAAHQAATDHFGAYGLDEIISPIVPHAINGGSAFFIAPDGSKEGWTESDRGDAARDELKEKLRGMPYLEWAEIQLGGDDAEYSIVDAPGSYADEGDIAF